MDIVSILIKPFAETLMVPVKKHLGYLFFCTIYVRDMNIKMRELNVARLGVEDHLNRNERNRLEIPSQVRGWLEEVRRIHTKVENTPSNVGSCFNIKNRHMLGRKVYKIIEEIDSVTRQHFHINWTDYPIPLGKVHSLKALTSTSLSEHNNFQSRTTTFIEALKALEPNHKSHMIALWGMGGVGKTTMMQMLKSVVKEKKIFNFIVEAVIGVTTEPIAIQEAVANYLGIELNEKTKPARAEKLRERFKAISEGGKNKFLIILDDVWQSVDLEDIGLSSFPNQGVNFKVLLTSRNRDVCTKMGVESNSILSVKILTEAEAQGFFRQFVELSDDVDPELNKIGKNIVSKCCGLPIAIKTMVCTLRNKSKDAWNDALSRIEHHDIHNVVPKVFEMSYDNLQGQETKSIFLLCGLFPEDFDIPTEDLVKYGWGLKLFSRVYTISQARTRLNTCIERLMHTNLLIKSDKDGCVKMHDLVHAFVLDMFTKVEHASIVRHGIMSEWPENDMWARSCKRISLSCKGMHAFPKEFKFQNLSILKLMHGDKSLSFQEDFYGEMENLQVISYNKMKYPLLPLSPQCCTNVRVLYLHQCSLMFDCSSIGNMLNLEVLSFANSDIECLPSTIGNLKKLKLLDLTECGGLRINNGVLKSLVKLEELYTICGAQPGKAIWFTNENCNEIAECSKTLSALEFEFFRNNAQPKNISFEKLERFKISVGCSFDVDCIKTKHSFENMLQIMVTTKDEILESKMNVLFDKTEVLLLSVKDMNDLEDVGLKFAHPPQSPSFYKLRVFVISDCVELRQLFTLRIAKALPSIEQLDVESCKNMEELIHTGSNVEEIITFPKLKFLSLRWLPMLSGLCHNANIIELPQLVELRLCGIPNITSIFPKDKFISSCLLKEEVVIPKLEKLNIFYMENLKELWPCEFRKSEGVKLKEIEVRYCDNLVNLFPCNPTPFLHHLEELELWHCGSVEVLFNIDLDCIGEIGEEESTSNSLRSIKVNGLGKLIEVWRITGANISHLHMRGFRTVECIDIRGCKKFRNVLTPAATNFDLGALREISINDCGESDINNELTESSQEEKLSILPTEETSKIINDISNVVIPVCHMHTFRNLRMLELWRYDGVDAVFEIECPGSTELVPTVNNQRLLPYLEELHITFMERMSHIWKCNWNKFLTNQKPHSESLFHNLKIIHVIKCKSIKYLFSHLMGKLLSNLKKVEIRDCDDMEEIVSNRDDKDETKTDCTNTSTTLFPRLDSLTLSGLKKLTHIGARAAAYHQSNELSFNNTTTTTVFRDQISEEGGVCWNLCQYSREIRISRCKNLPIMIPSYAVGHMQKLEVLKIESCSLMKEVFETGEINNNNGRLSVDGTGTPTVVGLNNVIMLELLNLKILEIKDCNLLKYIFTFSTLECLRKLEELKIENCKEMHVIVNEEHGEQERETKVVVFRRLKSIALVNLPSLISFFLGTNEFQWPLLDDVMINDCPKMTVFTYGQLKTPKLKYLHTRFGKYSLECGLNFPMTTTLPQNPFPILDNTSSSSTTLEGIPWSFQSLIILDLTYNKFIVKIIPAKESLHVQKLEKIHVRQCIMLEEVFEPLEGANSDFDISPSIVKLPNLRQVELMRLKSLRFIWKSNQWTIYEFQNLTRVSIDYCDGLEHVFTSSMVGSLLQLQELRISFCSKMEEVIVMDENVVVQKDKDGKMNEIKLPLLKLLELDSIPCLKGFCLGKEDFSLPLLNTLSIKKCPTITVFTEGNSSTPELKEIETSFGSFYVGKDVNSFIKIKQEEFKRR